MLFIIPITQSFPFQFWGHLARERYDPSWPIALDRWAWTNGLDMATATSNALDAGKQMVNKPTKRISFESDGRTESQYIPSNALVGLTIPSLSHLLTIIDNNLFQSRNASKLF